MYIYIFYRYYKYMYYVYVTSLLHSLLCQDDLEEELRELEELTAHLARQGGVDYGSTAIFPDWIPIFSQKPTDLVDWSEETQKTLFCFFWGWGKGSSF